MVCFLRFASDPLEDATRFNTKRDAVLSFAKVAFELDRIGQRIDASLHVARDRDVIHEYPDFVLSLGPRGGVRCEPC